MRLLRRSALQPAVDASQLKPCRWTKRVPGTEGWVKPMTVVEVAFSEWTPDGQIRHATFRGVRTDRRANTIVREGASMPAAQLAKGAARVAPPPSVAKGKSASPSIKIS
ncbi:ATP dependent DNA ligase [Roseateles aquatilis]|uniref:ATP dependent DNA ligase n=1 Tax=Roseateles aquatilis TaxID=431061 RepID=UPI002872BFA7|nr:hypothetical protein [Roseateles aquatilis]